jgi:carboxymethylenebutenolidase
MDKDGNLFTAPVARRAFVMTLVAGFTLATGPLNAQTIVTDANGLDAGEVKIPVSDGAIPGYRARPAGKTNAPVILVVHEVFGVHEHIRDICRRFAKLGYYAIAPSLFARFGDPEKYDMAHAHDLMTDIVAKVPDAEVMSDLDAAVRLASGEGADTARLGVTGFCWGGRIVWLYSAHNHAVKAAVAWYGPLAGTPTPLRPQTALDLASQVKTPVLGLYAGIDQSTSAADIDAMRKALAASGNTASRIDVFPDAQHGFFADYRPTYNEADAKEAWSRALAWFKANGV